MKAVSGESAVRVRGLRKTYKGARTPALDGVSFEVRRGTCFGLLGPNGAGKSTTLEIIQGVKRQSAGEVRIFGREFATDAGFIRSRMGGVLQENHLYGKLTVREALELFASLYPSPQAIGQTLEHLELSEHAGKPLASLSGGQRQRVHLGTALVGDPELLFLDEPTTGLDPATRQDFWRIIEGLKRRGKTVVLTTHYMEEAESLCDELVIIDKGRVIEGGTPADIIGRVMGNKEVPLRPMRFTLNDVFLTLTGRPLEVRA